MRGRTGAWVFAPGSPAIKACLHDCCGTSGICTPLGVKLKSVMAGQSVVITGVLAAPG